MFDMKIKAILFDLDGTLLPMDHELFVKTYFSLLAKKFTGLGFEPEKIVQTVWAGINAMVLNNGDKTNEEVFWNKYFEVYGKDFKNDVTYFDDFYAQDFDKIKISTSLNPQVPKIIQNIKALGFRLILATNPIFPKIATGKRIGWAGLNVEDFELITTYENSRHCKPNKDYYLDILKYLNLQPQECIMVGNDVTEDMVAKSCGINVFLLTDYLLNKDNKDISEFPNGNFNDLMVYIKNLM